MPMRAGFVISRSPVQVWSPAPSRSITYGLVAGIRISTLVVTFVLMAACAAPPLGPSPLPAQPPPPTGPLSWRMEVSPISQSDRAAISLYAVNGVPEVACTSNRGTIDTPIVRVNIYQAITLRGSTMPTEVVCVGNGETRRATVDLSAWSFQISQLIEENRQDQRAMTRLVLYLNPRVPSVPITHASVDWGDGYEDDLPGYPDARVASPGHHYPHSGVFLMHIKLAWRGGATDTQVRLERNCRSAAAFPDGQCEAQWWVVP